MTRITQIALDGMERKAKWVKSDAESLSQYASMIDDLPEWRTRAEDRLDEAEARLVEALHTVRQVRTSLRST